MSRRHAAEKRTILPDAKFGDLVLTKFINGIMLDGKKSVAERIVYGALDRMSAKGASDPVKAFHDAMENVKPNVEVRSRRVGGRPIRFRWKCAMNAVRLWRFAGSRKLPGNAPNKHGGSFIRRADGCGSKPWHGCEKTRRYAPYGRSQQSLRPLPLVK